MVDVKVYVKPDFVESNRLNKEERKTIGKDIIETFFNTLFDGHKPEAINTVLELYSVEEPRFYAVTFEIKTGLELTKLIIREWVWLTENEYLEIVN